MAGAYVLGEVITSLNHMAMYAVIFLTAAAVYGFFRYRQGRDRKKAVVFCLYFFVPACIGAFRMYVENMPTAIDKIYESMEMTNVLLRGEVCNADIRDERILITLKDCSINHVSAGKVLVFFEGETTYLPGMKIRVEGELARIDAPSNPGEFDYRTYYKSLGIRYRFFGEKAEIEDERTIPIRVFLNRVREQALKVLEDQTKEEDTGILKAVLLGDRTDLPDDVQQSYKEQGISHLLAISGLHVSLAGLALYRLLRMMGAGFAVSGIFSSLWLLGYGILTGAASSVVRAVLMLSVKFLGEYLGKSYDLLSSLSFAVILLLFEQPYLLWQGGFQMALSALLALGFFLPEAEKYMENTGKISRTFLAGIVVQMITAPITAYHYFYYPVYAIFLNMIVIPLMTYVVLSGFAGMILGFFMPGPVWAVFGPAHYILALYEKLLAVSERLPCSRLLTGRPALWQIFLYYILILFALYVAKYKNKKLSFLWLKLLPVMYGMIFLLFPVAYGGFETVFLDVGQGDGIYMSYQGVHFLVDFGSSSKKNIGENLLVPFLESRRVQSLDYVWITHADEDHVNGIRALFAQDSSVQIENLLIPWESRDKEEYVILKKQAEDAGIHVLYGKKGDRICVGNLLIRQMYPPESFSAEEIDESDRNNDSQVLYVTLDQFSMLLTGDVGKDGEQLLDTWLESEPLQKRVSVLKVAHHGSGYSTGERFLKQTQPVFSVISCGRDNRYGHPDKETVKRLKKAGSTVYSTVDKGALILHTGGRYITWHFFIQSMN